MTSQPTSGGLDAQREHLMSWIIPTSGLPPPGFLTYVVALAFIGLVLFGFMRLLGSTTVFGSTSSATFNEQQHVETRAKSGFLDRLERIAALMLAAMIISIAIGVVLGSLTISTGVAGVIFSVAMVVALMTVVGLITTARGSVSAMFRTRLGSIGAAPIC